MCTISVNVNESEMRSFNPSLTDTEAITRWVQLLVDSTVRRKIGNTTEDSTAFPDMDKEFYPPEEAYGLVMKDINAIYDVSKQKDVELKPYTMAELDSMLDEAEAAFEAGDYLTQEEVFHHNKLAR